MRILNVYEAGLWSQKTKPREPLRPDRRQIRVGTRHKINDWNPIITNNNQM